MAPVLVSFAAFFVLACCRVTLRAIDRRWHVAARAEAMCVFLLEACIAAQEIRDGRVSSSNVIAATLMTYIDTLADAEESRHA